MKGNIFICLLALFLSACASTYQLPNDVSTSSLTVRSPQGQRVSALIYGSVDECTGQQVLKSNSGSKASKTYTLPSSEVMLSISMLPGAVNSYACRVTVKMNAEDGQHYVVDLVSNKGKQRCDNRIFNVKNKEVQVNAQYVDAVAPLLSVSKASFCDKYEFKDITSESGKFVSTAYKNNAYATGTPGVIGTTTSALKEK